MIQRENGSVLIVTLLVLFFLSATALSLAHRMRLELKLVSRYVDKTKSFYVARGALSLVLEKLKDDKLQNEFDWPKEGWRLEFQREMVPESKDFTDIDGAVGGTYKVVVGDESSRMNINKTTPQLLENLLGHFKGIEAKKTAREIFAYKRNKPQDNNFYSVYELLKIKAIKKDIFWGEDTNENGILDSWENDGNKSLPPDDQDGEMDWGLKDLLTVYTDGRININTVSLPVLLSMPGIDRDIARDLMEVRDRKPFNSLEDLKKLSSISDEVFARISVWASVKSDQFRVNIIAKTPGAKVGRQILAIVDRSDDSPGIIYWRED